MFFFPTQRYLQVVAGRYPAYIEGENKMQVLCKTSETTVETQCTVCGQGFALYFERQTRSERAEALRQIEQTLRTHHQRSAGPEAHPTRGFLVPEWNGPVAFSGAAILGCAPSWAL